MHKPPSETNPLNQLNWLHPNSYSPTGYWKALPIHGELRFHGCGYTNINRFTCQRVRQCIASASTLEPANHRRPRFRARGQGGTY